MISVFIKRLSPVSIVPQRKTPGSACVDLSACESGILYPRTRALIGTGIAIEVPPGYEAQVRPRSGLALSHGITVLNSPGTIDSDYRGEIKVLLVNHGSERWVYAIGDRIAQLAIRRIATPELVQVNELSPTIRGEGGFGSTDIVPREI